MEWLSILSERKKDLELVFSGQGKLGNSKSATGRCCSQGRSGPFSISRMWLTSVKVLTAETLLAAFRKELRDPWWWLLDSCGTTFGESDAGNLFWNGILHIPRWNVDLCPSIFAVIDLFADFWVIGIRRLMTWKIKFNTDHLACFFWKISISYPHKPKSQRQTKGKGGKGVEEGGGGGCSYLPWARTATLTVRPVPFGKLTYHGSNWKNQLWHKRTDDTSWYRFLSVNKY